MKKILILAMFVLVSGLAMGQIVHHEISSSSGLRIASMTSVSDFSNNYDSYVVGTTYDKKVFVGQLDNNTPIGLNSSTFTMFQLPDSHSSYFFNGAFVDMDGNIVAYGYCHNSIYSNIGLIVKCNISNNVATSMEYSISLISNSVVDDGCWGKLTSGRTVYAFVINKHYFVRVPSFQSVGAPIVKKFTDTNEAMSVSWDVVNSKFVLSGSYGSNCFVGTFPNSNSIANGIRTFSIYTMPSTLTPSEYTGKHVLSGNLQYSDGVAYLVQDFRDLSTSTDGVWVLKVNYMNNSVVGSMGYKLDSSKVSVFDVAHNYDHLFVLGHHIGNHNESSFSKRFLMQINLYDSTDVLTCHLKTIPQVNYNRNTSGSYLSRIMFNQYTFFVQSVGAFGDNGYLSESYMLEDENCDSLINNELYAINYTASIGSPYNTSSLMSVWGENNMSSTSVFAVTTETFTMSEDCSSGLERNYESQIENTKERLTNKLQLAEKNKQVLSVGEIDVDDNNTFVCSKFSGKCEYWVYDIHGRVVAEGKTENGSANYLKGLLPGLYLIKVIDSNNSVVVQKIIFY
ncbi:MAG: T9SS type A sorting domain-containing protein [Bacteroidales bacterium]|nr:T9SS type A sorting domain-containing protein [Bacteroidales bacterium]